MRKKESYDPVEEANEIANEAFGDDYQFALAVLSYYANKAEKCGCPQCRKEYDLAIERKWKEWERPVEDDDNVTHKIQVYAPKGRRR